MNLTPTTDYASGVKLIPLTTLTLVIRRKRTSADFDLGNELRKNAAEKGDDEPDDITGRCALRTPATSQVRFSIIPGRCIVRLCFSDQCQL